MWNATDTPAVIYYGASFADYIGHVDRTLTMVYPVNGVGYDSFIYGNYFALTVEGAAAADDTTLAAIDAIASIPENVTLANRATVEAARAAYDRITSFEQRALVHNLSVLEAAEQRIKDLEYIANGDGETEKPEEEVTPDEKPETNEQKGSSVDTRLLIAARAVDVVLLALSILFAILYIKARTKSAGAVTASAEKTEHVEDEKTETSDDNDETV